MRSLEGLFGKTILVTGSTGMVGQNIVQTINDLNKSCNANITVLAHGRNVEKWNYLYNTNNFSGTIIPIIGDITDFTVSQPVNYIIHAASVTGGSKQHLEYPYITLNTAIEGTKHVLELAKSENSSGVVFLSSLEIYGNTGNSKRFITEDDGGYIDSMNPRSSYSEGKRISECLFAAYAKQFNLNAKVARLTASFGYGVNAKDQRVFAQFARSILDKKNIILQSTGETVRNYCDPLDVATALLTILLYGQAGEAYNVANMDTEISIKDLAQRFIDLYPESGTKMEFDLAANYKTLGHNPVMRNVLNSEKLMQLGWEPQYSIDDMITHLISSMKESRII